MLIHLTVSFTIVNSRRLRAEGQRGLTTCLRKALAVIWSLVKAARLHETYILSLQYTDKSLIQAIEHCLQVLHYSTPSAKEAYFEACFTILAALTRGQEEQG